ncbi:hypothetical protein [Desertivirga arenae]|uniref:hypothetical protein n=1 Tax=Desertivirga arenae TaxID=2810309 RepID=UPI001A978E99|nr:hypothetical protein [Pedobacter sp. SYSU D00823]
MHAIEFTCWEDDTPIDVFLEPEALNYPVKPGKTIKFIPVDPTIEFFWTVRITHEDRGIQLFPEPIGAYKGIAIYMNNTLIETIS